MTMTLAGRDMIARMRIDASMKPRQVFDLAVNRDMAAAFDPATEARITQSRVTPPRSFAPRDSRTCPRGV